MNTALKIISWNVNGLRALDRSGDFDVIMKRDPDILCLQEIKAEADQLPDHIREPKGYHSFFNPAKVRKGYSGTAMYSKIAPDVFRTGLSDDAFNQEGRMITAKYGDLIVMNGYFPNGGKSPEHFAYKMGYYDQFLEDIEAHKVAGRRVIACGDFNVAHNEIDIARPKENANHVGFLPEEREWMDSVIDHGWVDVFRETYPDKADMYTYWDQITRARERNVGWRIDYFIVDPVVAHKVTSIKHLTDVYGSDHCPVEMIVTI